MTTEYYGMTPWEYNEWARSRETAGDYTYVWDGRGSVAPGSSRGLTTPTEGRSSTGGTGGTGGSQGPSSPSTPTDPFKDIDRSPFELNEHDAIALAQQQRARDATAYRYNLAGLPQPIELWSGSVADTQRTTPLGTVASLMPGTGAFADSESLRAYQLAREAYMQDPIAAALRGETPATTPTTPAPTPTRPPVTPAPAPTPTPLPAPTPAPAPITNRGLPVDTRPAPIPAPTPTVDRYGNPIYRR